MILIRHDLLCDSGGVPEAFPKFLTKYFQFINSSTHQQFYKKI